MAKMKFLAFTDLHASMSAWNRVKEKVKEHNPEALLFGGDVTIFGHNMDGILAKLNQIRKPIYLIHGNHESRREMEEACKPYKYLKFIHHQAIIFKDVIIIGNGGGGFSMKDLDFMNAWKKHKKIIEKHPDKRIILISHAPVYDTKTDLIMEEHCGNKTILDFINEHKPALVIVGHLHECEEEIDYIGKTKIINPGPFGTIEEV